MGAIRSIIDLLRYGAEVADPESWKKGQINVNKLILLLSALVGVAHAFGFATPVSDATVAAIACGVFALVNLVITVVSSSRAGLLPSKPVQPDRFPALDAEQPGAAERRSAEPYNAERGS